MLKRRSLGQLITAITTISVLFACQSGTDAKSEEKPNEKRTMQIEEVPDGMKDLFKVDSASRQKRIEKRLKRRAKRDSVAKAN